MRPCYSWPADQCAGSDSACLLDLADAGPMAGSKAAGYMAGYMAGPRAGSRAGYMFHSFNRIATW